MGEAGKDYQLRIKPDPLSANNVTAVRWELDNTTYATIDKDTGLVHVNSVGLEENNPHAKAICYITTNDGTVITAERTIGFYVRSCKVGDMVFADGTFSDVNDDNKTVVGVCFYINPYDKTQRLCVSTKDLPSSVWGLFYDSSNGANGFKEVVLEDNPDYSAFDIPTIQNIASSGLSSSYVNEETYRDETTAGDTDGFKIVTGAAADIGFTTVDEAIGGYKKGEVIPIGLLKTLKIMAHRDLILNDPALDDLPVPADEGAGLYQATINAINNAGTIAAKYKQFYYPAASLCNAYKPGVKQGETLAECFGQGKWFLPAEGDLMRMYWYHRLGYGYDDNGVAYPYHNANTLGVFNAFSNTLYWSSTEYSQTDAWHVNFSNGHAYGTGKCIACSVRAVAAF